MTSSQYKRHGRIFLVIVILAGILTEWGSYWLQAQRWPAVSCSKDDEYCLRVLLVADPQIIGERHELGFPVGTIVRWDSDRYLSKTFHYAQAHVRPHAVIFLGDLMDEGSISTFAEFARYYARFENIFPPEPGVQVIYLPGDNDIGGENEPITHEKITKFQEKFGQPDVMHLRGISFIKVNRLRYTVPKLPPHSWNETRIVLSHVPLLPRPSPFIDHAVANLGPHLVLSAHDHHAKHASAPREGRPVVSVPLVSPLRLQLAERSTLHELLIPTCSYRMGVPDMAYGALALDTRTLELSLFLLWLPGRFPQLLGYLALLLVLCLKFACLHCKNMPRKNRLYIKHIQT